MGAVRVAAGCSDRTRLLLKVVLVNQARTIARPCPECFSNEIQ